MRGEPVATPEGDGQPEHDALWRTGRDARATSGRAQDASCCSEQDKGLQPLALCASAVPHCHPERSEGSPPFKTGDSSKSSQSPFDLAPYLEGDHLFILTDNEALIRRLVSRGIRPLVVITHDGTARSRYRARKRLDLAHQLGLRPVAVAPVYFLRPEDVRIHRVLTAIRLNTTIDTLRPEDAAPDTAWFRSPKEMQDLYGEWPETLDNIEWVAERCELDLELGAPIFPEFPIPEGETSFSFLWKLSFEGVKQRYQPLRPDVTQRLQYELDIINQLGFAAYFLIVSDIVRHAREQDISIMGRGSAANSLVAYALGITRVDPFKYDLYFERFMNPYRTDCPDIDLDICWRRRDEVIDYVYKTYGAHRVAMICTLNTFKARAAVRDVARAFGLPPGEIDALVRGLPHYTAQDIRKVVEFLPECRHMKLNEEPLKSILEIAEQIDGFPRHLSIHSGGVVIAPDELTRYTPLQRSAKGILITQHDMHSVEDLGLVKMDLLGHRSLTVIRDTVDNVRANRGIEVDVEALPDPDPLTAELIRQGHTIGCFQIESPAMRALLQQTQSDNTDMLIKTLSLVRPGPSGSGMKHRFIARRLGKEKTEYLHPSLEKVLGDTYGVMLYQEDTLKVAQAIAGISLAEADAMRRALSKKRSPRALAKLMKGFIDQAQANGVAPEVAEEIWGQIANFAEYSYCKAHASTYGEISYQCTYLKAHFTAEFLASVLSNRGGFYHPAVYIEEARRYGIEVHPPDVNHSHFDYMVESEAIRMGFVEVRNLTRHAAVAVVAAREQDGPFSTLGELFRRTGIGTSDLEILIQAGACDGLGATRPELMWELHLLKRHGQQPGSGDTQLFADTGRNGLTPHRPDYSRRDKMDLEWAHLGLLVSTHPLEYYLQAAADGRLVMSTDLAGYAGQRVTLIGWLIAERRVGLRGRGCMKFLTFEDPCGVFEAVMFPAAYQEYGHLLDSHGPFYVTGQVQDEDTYCSVVVEGLEKAGERPKSPGTSEVNPPLRWITHPSPGDTISHAD
jgi:DNA-directed DNA polymerase III PolC